MADGMMFPDTVEEFMEMYKMVDTDEVYSNGTEYVPIFRMEQWFDHVKQQQTHGKHTDTHGVCSDAISRQAAMDYIGSMNMVDQIDEQAYIEAMNYFESLPSARPTGEWIVDEGQQVLMQKAIADGEDWKVCSVCGCGFMVGHKYNTDKTYHKTFRNFCPNCGADMRPKIVGKHADFMMIDEAVAKGADNETD